MALNIYICQEHIYNARDPPTINPRPPRSSPGRIIFIPAVGRVPYTIRIADETAVRESHLSGSSEHESKVGIYVITCMCMCIYVLALSTGIELLRFRHGRAKHWLTCRGMHCRTDLMRRYKICAVGKADRVPGCTAPTCLAEHLEIRRNTLVTTVTASFLVPHN
jgi:hypothetical protein